MDAFSIAAAAAVGLASGLLSALAGVGGATVSTPGIRALGAAPLFAVGSTVPAIIPSAVAGSIRYARVGLVRWRVGIVAGVSGMVSAFAGAWVAGLVEPRWLMVLTALLVLWSSATLLAPRRTPPGAAEPADGAAALSVGAASAAALVPAAPTSTATVESRDSVWLVIAVGTAAGFVAGLLGVGGGILLVPTFSTLLRLSVKETIATSLVAVAMMSIASLAGHVLGGHVEWPFALALAAGAGPGAWIGSRITVAAREATMRTVCGVLLAIVGTVFLATELLATRPI